MLYWSHAVFYMQFIDPPKPPILKLEVGVSWLTNLFNFPRSQKRPQVSCILVDWFVSQCVMRLLAQCAFDFQQWIALNSLDIEVNVCPRKISKPCSCTSKSKLANLKLYYARLSKATIMSKCLQKLCDLFVTCNTSIIKSKQIWMNMWILPKKMKANIHNTHKISSKWKSLKSKLGNHIGDIF